ncbi:hypothetical protein JJL45_11050 [Tamlana sp. s12]|uniref:hypothetical protein n=1 Tax=Tamlana sp. s12 TaxID=1630406 RepID=UPI0007FE0448|nr:hypothetical protein [Tamlana sp. s12]OBQ52519.1 hypothetical protein VQ01_13600 [Tamlana sp. s12]QQY81465.1 hypothetical protein JJL45_11050 [Tamlana sp. s12]
MNKPIGDLHCHPSFKPSNNPDISDIWTYKKNIHPKDLFKGILGVSPRRWMVNLFVKDLATYTQSNLDSCYEGDNRLLFLSIYPIERQFLRPDRPFATSTLIQRFILAQVFGIELKRHIDSRIIQILTGFSSTKVVDYLKSVYDSEYVDYFKTDFALEYKYINQSHLSCSPNAEDNVATFQLVSNYEEYVALRNQNIIAGILTVEGAHALGEYNSKDLVGDKMIDDLSEENKEKLKASFIRNISALKDKEQFEFTPFFITFAHHFNNLLTGHAKSFGEAKNKSVPGFSNVFNQKNGLDLGISEFGKELIKSHLLSRHNGQRILIDTKHMSLQARNDYAAIVKALRDEGDAVPIVISHTAINGISTRAKAAERLDTNQLDKYSYVSRWDINITDEDIREVFDSKGIIGVCMHDGRMPGGKFKDLLKSYKKRWPQKEFISKLHTQMFLTNVFHIVKINLDHIRTLNDQTQIEENKISEVQAWKTICLGSDNDGIVDPFDNFNTASTLKDFKTRVKKAIDMNFDPCWKRFKILAIEEENYRFFDENEITELKLGLTSEEIVDRIFSDNVETFLSTYFVRSYLEGTEN